MSHMREHFLGVLVALVLAGAVVMVLAGLPLWLAAVLSVVSVAIGLWA